MKTRSLSNLPISALFIFCGLLQPPPSVPQRSPSPTPVDNGGSLNPPPPGARHRYLALRLIVSPADATARRRHDTTFNAIVTGTILLLLNALPDLTDDVRHQPGPGVTP